MSVRRALWFLVLLSALPIVAQESPAGITVEAIGLRIVAPAPDGDDDLRAFNWSAGVTVAMLVSMPQGGIILVDDEASKILAFTDDQGKDLTKSGGGENSFFDRPGFDMQPRISKDGRKLAIEARAPGLPTRGAGALRVQGELVLQTATQKQEFAADGVKLAPGSAIGAGPIPFTVTQAGKPEWGGEEDVFAVTLQARQAPVSVAEVKFFDAGGNPLEARRGMTSSMGGGGSVTVEWQYLFKTKVDVVRVVIEHWTDLKTVKVPIDLTVKAGL